MPALRFALKPTDLIPITGYMHIFSSKSNKQTKQCLNSTKPTNSKNTQKISPLKTQKRKVTW